MIPMTLTAKFRKHTPDMVWQAMGFLKRLPAYWRMDRNGSLRLRHGLSENHIFVNEELCLSIPESLTANHCWMNHGLIEEASRQEALDFLDLAEGCHSFVDIGAQTGFMSALFAKSRKGPCRILSVEPDSLVLPVLNRAAALNKSAEVDWKVVNLAVSNVTQTLTLPTSNTLFEAWNEPPRDTMTVPAVTLADLLSELSWRPDIIKIDVESFEYEILCSSLDLIGQHKPALHLEVHWQMLSARGKSAFDFLKPLSELGYRGIRKSYGDLKAWEKRSSSEFVSRLSLRVC